MKRVASIALAITVATSSLLAAGGALDARPAYACAGEQQWTAGNQALLDALPQVRLGDRGAAVLALQIQLRYETGSKLVGTGYFGRQTLSEVQTWQRRHNIQASGIVERNTWKTFITNPSQEIIPISNPQLSPGQRWPEDSGYLQLGLIALSQDVAWGPDLDFDNQNRYTGDQVELVKAFQQHIGLNPSGILGARTTNALALYGGPRGGFGC